MRAPVAMRMPISRVRSVTLTSMMFMTPMPPTSSEIAAIEPSRIVSVFCVSVAVSRIDAMLRIWKSVVRWWRDAAARSPRPGSRRCASTSSTATVMLRRKRWPNSRRLPVVSGTNTTSSWSVPLRRGAARRHHADDLEQHVVEHDVLADRVDVRAGTALSATVWPSTTTVRVAASRPPARRRCPCATGQLRASGKSAVVPVACGLVVGVAVAHGDAAARARAPRRARWAARQSPRRRPAPAWRWCRPTPLRLGAPGRTSSRFVPMRADAVEHRSAWRRRRSRASRSPRPTPITMPSSVSTVRNRLARSARTAVFAASSASRDQRAAVRARRLGRLRRRHRRAAARCR